MSKSAKKVVKNFLESDVFVNPDSFSDYFSKNLVINWHASSGFKQFDYNEYERLCQSTASSYRSMRTDVTHIFSSKSEVAARFTVYVKTIENPSEEIPVGYFVSIFKVEDEKICEIHQSSHPQQ
ncbi:MAG: nuclear transport factor 2 family protein [Nonlabens sp.]